MQMNKFLKIIKKRLDNYKNANNNCQKLNEVIFELDELVNIAETQISQSNNGWISVDDELPKEFETVLLFGKKYNGETIITDGHLIQCLIDEFGIQDGFSAKMLVSHWQYLPKPPKE